MGYSLQFLQLFRKFSKLQLKNQVFSPNSFHIYPFFYILTP